MDFYEEKIAKAKFFCIFLALLIFYNLFQLQFIQLSDTQIHDCVLNGQVNAVAFGIANIWHDYLNTKAQTEPKKQREEQNE